MDKFKVIVMNFSSNNYDYFLHPYRKVMLNIIYHFASKNKDIDNKLVTIFFSLITDYTKSCISDKELFF